MTPTNTAPAHKRRFTVSEYHRLADAGILQEDDRVELLYGEIVEMSPIGPKHAGTVDRIVRVLTFLFGETAIVRGQNPILLNDYSEPLPDVAILRPRDDFYTTAHPTAEEVLIVIELSDSSLAFDRQIKLPAYAAGNIPEYWIIDLTHDRIMVHTDPSEDQYLTINTYHLNDRLDSPGLPTAIEVKELLG